MNVTLRRRAVTSGALSTLLLSRLGTPRVLADGGPWPQFHGDARHAGTGTAVGPRSLTVAWYVPTLGDVDGSPAIAADGSVYVASVDGTVYGISPDGGVRWSFNAGTTVLGSVALSPDGRLLFGDARGRVRSVNPADGTIGWTASGYGGVRGTPAISADGTAYFGTDAGELVALDRLGMERFKQRAELDVTGSPAIAPNGDVYWGAMDHRLRRMAAGGDVIWSVDLGGAIAGAAAIGLDGTVYLGVGESVLAVQGDSGAVKWRVPTGSAVTATPAIAPDGTVYVGAESGRFYAIRSDGSVRWETQTGGAIRSSAAAGSDGAVYFGSGDAIVYAFDANGQRLSTYRALDSVHGAAAMGSDGTVFIGGRDNRLYAFRENSRRFNESPADRLGGDLVRDPASGKVYVIVAGRRRHIPDPQTQLILGLAGPVPFNLTGIEAARYPEGQPLPSLREGTLLRASNGPLYALRSGRRAWIRSLEEFEAGGYQWDSLAAGADDLVVRTVPLTLENGFLVKGGGERVYLVENGLRRWISTQQAFEVRGFSWSNVHFVSDAALNALREGEPLA